MVRRIRFIQGNAVFGVRNCFGLFGIVPEASRTFRSGNNVAPLAGRGRGPTRECPGRIGPGAQGPIGPAGQALGETLGRASRRGELAPHSSLVAAGPRLGGGGKGQPPTPLYKVGRGAPSPHTSSSPSRLAAALLSLSRLCVGEALP